jgi:hypothetical protein
VLQDSEHRLRKPTSLDLLRAVIAEMVSPFYFDVRGQKIVYQWLRDLRGQETLAHLREIHLGISSRLL